MQANGSNRFLKTFRINIQNIWNHNCNKLEIANTLIHITLSLSLSLSKQFSISMLHNTLYIYIYIYIVNADQ